MFDWHEAVRLAVVLLCCAAMVGFVMRRQTRLEGSTQMAETIKCLKAENERLQAQVRRLEITVDTVLAENGRLQQQVATLRRQLQDLDHLVQVNRHDADDWRAAAERKGDGSGA